MALDQEDIASTLKALAEGKRLGKSNQKIAETLFISRRALTTRLQKIAKLYDIDHQQLRSQTLADAILYKYASTENIESLPKLERPFTPKQYKTIEAIVAANGNTLLASQRLNISNRELISNNLRNMAHALRMNNPSTEEVIEAILTLYGNEQEVTRF